MESTIREQILDATVLVFNKKGMKFTMDDIARELGMSKKTIYTVFADKQSWCMIWLITASTR